MAIEMPPWGAVLLASLFSFTANGNRIGGKGMIGMLNTHSCSDVQSQLSGGVAGVLLCCCRVSSSTQSLH